MRWLKILLPIGLLVVTALASWSIIAARPETVRTPAPPPSLLVDVAVAARQPVTFEVHSQGTVTPRTRTTLVSEVAGQIVDVAPAFVSGGFFKQGDVLVRIDPRTYETALKRARSELAQAKTKVETEHALASYAKADWERLRGLEAAGPTDASDLTLRKPQLAEAIAGLEFARANYEKASEDLNRTIIRAPYDGMVREKLADVGQFVNTGSQLAETFATDYAEVRLPLPQAELKYLDLPETQGAKSLPATLSADIGGVTHTWQARVVRSEGVFDTESRALHVVAQIDAPYNPADGAEPLRIGTFVTATIEGRAGGDLFVVPRHSLERGETLWLVGEDMAIEPRNVDIVRSDEQFAYVASGLANGDRYTVTPPEQPLPGMMVRVNE
jgi:RND family efflux transporter MFP subunit